MKEDYALVLDYLPEGRYTDFKHNPIVQALGVDNFTLLELIPKQDATFEPLEKIFIGKGEREKIALVKRTLTYNELTTNAKLTLEPAILKIIDENPEKFLRFFNKAGPVSVKLHQLELLPNVGKKVLKDILDARSEKEFESFEDISNRVKTVPKPRHLLTQRIIEEIKGESKYYIFARRPYKPNRA